MTVASSKDAQKRAESSFKREERARDGTKAMQEYVDEARAIAERTARLRALRLAKEAAEKNENAATVPVEPPLVKSAPVRPTSVRPTSVRPAPVKPASQRRTVRSRS